MEQYVLFRMGSETFALDIELAEEVLDRKTITRVPKTRHFILGVINYRGEILPVITLKEFFDIEGRPDAEEQKIIVVRVNDLRVGLLVDRMQEILAVGEKEIQPPPEGGGAGTKYIRGIFRRGKKPVAVLDISEIIVPGASGVEVTTT